MSTLVVVDMQQSFIFRHDQFPGYGKTIDAVKEEIIAAKNRNDYIVFVEYCYESRSRQMFNKFSSRYEPTMHELLDLVANYPNKVFCYKKQNDGGEEVVEALYYYNIAKTSLRVCGVYTNACVRATVQTISEKLPSSFIKVIKDATCAPGGDDWQKDEGISMMNDLDNVRFC